MKNIAIILIFALTSISVLGQKKMGYIQIDCVRIVLPDYKYSEAKLKKTIDVLNDSLSLLGNRLNKFYEKYLIDVDYCWNSTLEKHFNDTLVKLQNEIENYREYAHETIGVLQEKERKRLDSELNSFIMEFCKKNNIECILEKKFVFYCSECVDYTKELKDFIINK